MAEPLNPSGAQDRTPGFRRVDIPSLRKEKAAFRERIVGQEDAVDAFAGLVIKIQSVFVLPDPPQ